MKQRAQARLMTPPPQSRSESYSGKARNSAQVQPKSAKAGGQIRRSK